MWRQGDVLIAQVTAIPQTAQPLRRTILASGDATGQRHRLKHRRSGQLYRTEREMYLEVIAEEATIVHPEHDDITLPRGLYRVWRQREFTDGRPQFVAD
jgi:hypothetical protein